ncbi:MAG: malonyl-CoA O-methyltransferase [Candidatus Omnitrophota bacterium]|jgi:malonyl-CoA O-methyltransferase
MPSIDLMDDKIQHKFSESSMHYDVLALLHREIGRELYGKMKDVPKCDFIIDVGMGTGWMTNRLWHIFPGSNVVGLDFAKGMIDVAKKRDGEFSVLQADAHYLPFADNSIDIVASNLAYQWMGDLGQTFKECRRVMSSEGRLFMTMFGFDTFNELFTSLKHAYGKEKKLPIDRLATMEHVQEVVNEAGFTNVNVHRESIQVRYPDMMALFKWIKGLGANALKNDVFIGKELWQKADEYYAANFKDKHGIYATFEIIWITADK